MKKAIRSSVLDAVNLDQETQKRIYASPKLQSLGDIRGVTMGTGSKNPDLGGPGLQT